MQDSTGPQPKQLLSERIKNATNILVTVSRDPSVDELSAALALTVMLNKMDKHATAVFSGKIPPAISFLNPEKTFEGTVDSLRDFIIALDKEKADRLRYKVEDDVVRIFITPYRTVISEKDLAFSQGDFNVELIVALGVEKKEDLDSAISAHGRILHDAVVATVNTSNRDSALGTIDWTDASASSYSEMLMSLSESLKSGILDEQIATALLTGIVAATERFSNNKTTPKVMTMSAQLMAAGANQQLIATKLEEGNALPAKSESHPDGSTKLEEGSSQKVSKDDAAVKEEAPAEDTKPDGELDIEHEAPSEAEQAVEKATELADSAEEQQTKTEAELDKVTQQSAQPAAPTLSVEDLKKDLAAASKDFEQAAAASVVDEPISTHKSDWQEGPQSSSEPLFGGTLNATADEAHEAKERENRLKRNHTILNHDEPTVPQAPLNAVSPGYKSDEPASVDPFAEPPKSEPTSPLHYEPIDTHGPTIQPLSTPPPIVDEPTKTDEPADQNHVPTLSELEAQAHSAAAANPVGDARAAVNAALEALPFNPANEPLASAGAQPLSGPSLHPDQPSESPFVAPPVGSTSPDPIVSTVPNLPPPPPPLPDFSTLPPLPAESEAPAASSSPFPANNAPQFGAATPVPAPTTPSPTDPGQFKLPGQV